MPSWFPEGNSALPSDDEARSLKKRNSQLFDTYGNVGAVPFPEGTEPLPQDDEARSLKKINAILKTLS
jgi:hypothetical protein